MCAASRPRWPAPARSGMPAVRADRRAGARPIIDALNDAGLRLAEARQEAGRTWRPGSRAPNGWPALGRVAAGVAHEIRNPIAAARLQGENALAGDDARRREAIGDMLGQIDRLDGLVGELLAMTQRVEPRPVPVGPGARSWPTQVGAAQGHRGGQAADGRGPRRRGHGVARSRRDRPGAGQPADQRDPPCARGRRGRRSRPSASAGPADPDGRRQRRRACRPRWRTACSSRS